jgi:hypothetical protein
MEIAREDKYTKESKEGVDTGTRGALTGRQRSGLCHKKTLVEISMDEDEDEL